MLCKNFKYQNFKTLIIFFIFNIIINNFNINNKSKYIINNKIKENYISYKKSLKLITLKNDNIKKIK